MRKMMTGVAFAAALLMCGGSASAVDQLLTGKKLLILTPPSGPANNKIVYLNKDTDIANPASSLEDPRCPTDGTNSAQLRLRSQSTLPPQDLIIPLPCANWTVNGAGNMWKYKDTSGATCKIVIIKGTKLMKAVCKGAQVAWNLGQDQGEVEVGIRAGSAPRRWCTAFDDVAPLGCTVVKNGIDNKKYLAKNCTGAPATCTASPSGAFVDVASLF